MPREDSEKIRETIRKHYKGIAESVPTRSSCCSPSCCGERDDEPTSKPSIALGYSIEAISGAPQGAEMGLGCGNPLAIASLKPGETVLDLGSGGGFDAFLAARAVGENGQVIGVDATPEMVHKARRLATENGYDNVEFRLGEIENLPLPDSSVDAIISNCVINLSLEKPRVFEEASRVLRPGGRLAISDVVATAELPAEVKDDLSLYSSCVAGACTVDQLESMLERAGFTAIHVRPRGESKTFIRDWVPGLNAADFVVSAIIEATKPT